MVAHLLDGSGSGRPPNNFSVPIQVCALSGVRIDGGTLTEYSPSIVLARMISNRVSSIVVDCPCPSASSTELPVAYCWVLDTPSTCPHGGIHTCLRGGGD